MKHKASFLILATLLLAACATAPQRKAAAPAPAPVAGSGGYLAGDGPDDHPPANLDAIPDAVPKAEPLHRYANRPYVALGKTYTPLTQPGNYTERGVASWYGRKFNGQRTSSGESYDMYAMSAAHPTLPIPSYARVTNLANHKSVVVRINDRGPFLENRIIDLSYTAAYRLGIVGDGSSEVEVESINPDVSINTVAANTVQSQPLDNSAPIPAAPVAAAAPAQAPAPVVAATAPVAPAAAPAAAPADPAPGSSALQSTDTSVYLQLGAFESQANAQAFLEKMRGQLGDTGKQLVLSNKEGMVRVHIGPYSSVNDARSSADILAGKLGFKPMVNLP